MPATSPGENSSTLMSKFISSAQRVYILYNISAQSCASVPPDPDWISTKAFARSFFLEKYLFVSRSSIWDSSKARAFNCFGISPSSLISNDIFSVSSISLNFSSIPLNSLSLVSFSVFSLFSLLIFMWSFQISGSSNFWLRIWSCPTRESVSYTHLTLPTNREV